MTNPRVPIARRHLIPRRGGKAVVQTLAVACFVCGMACPKLAAQSKLTGSAHVGLGTVVEKGNKLGSIDGRVGVFVRQDAGLATGLEFGFSRLGVEEQRVSLPEATGYVSGLERTSRKMWHATAVARRHWGVAGRPRLYVAGGSGVYMLTHSSESTLFDSDGGFFASGSQKTTDRSWQFGLNFGGGVELGRIGPGAFSVDARVHVLPFSGSRGFSLATFAVGLNLF